jgi:hypothetical protein
VTYTSTTRQEDDYEKLAKGIGYYNSDTPGFTVRSWPYLLKHKVNPPENSTSNEGNNCFTCRYTIQVRNEKYGLPYRQYIWQGRTYEADLTDAEGNPDPRAGQAWCFRYGEEEWINPGFKVSNPDKPAERIGARYQDYLDRADNNDKYKIACE